MMTAQRVTPRPPLHLHDPHHALPLVRLAQQAATARGLRSLAFVVHRGPRPGNAGIAPLPKNG